MLFSHAVLALASTLAATSWWMVEVTVTLRIATGYFLIGTKQCRRSKVKALYIDGHGPSFSQGSR